VAEQRTGTILRLPADARPSFDVYVNGVVQVEGVDFTYRDGAIHFTRPLDAGQPEGLWQKLVMSTAGVGYYNRGDSIDVHYQREDGTAGVVSGKRVEPAA
jgi:hypothetical protein